MHWSSPWIQKQWVFYLIGWGAMVLMVGCGSPSSTGLAFKITFASAQEKVLLCAEGSPEPGTIPSDITTFRLCVSAADLDKPQCQNFAVADYQVRGKARMDGIPTGDDRKVTFKGYDQSFSVNWCGEVSGIAIHEDETTQVTMFITACRNFTTPRNKMTAARVFHTVTPLLDGRAMVVGGFHILGAIGDCSGRSCARITASIPGDSWDIEIFDPRTGLFTPLVNSTTQANAKLNHGRGLHTATLLSDGRVLVAGGCEKAIWYTSFINGLDPILEVDPDDGFGFAGSEAEIIDPLTGTVEKVSSAMSSRASHRAVLLPNGDVVLLGGFGPDKKPSLTATRYQAAANQFIEIGALLAEEREGMLLIPFQGPDPLNALIWGGNNDASGSDPGVFAEILSVNSNNDISSRGSTTFKNGIAAHYAAGDILKNGEVLVTGGMIFVENLPSVPTVSNEFRLVNLATETITQPNVLMQNFRAFHTATLLAKPNRDDDPDLKVLLVGGLSKNPPRYDLLSSVSFYAPWESNFQVEQLRNGETVQLSNPRAAHTSTALSDGTILIIGGFTLQGEPLKLAISDTVEIFNPTSQQLKQD